MQRRGATYRDTVERIIVGADGRAVQKGPTRWDWHAAGDCQEPVQRDLSGRSDVQSKVGPLAIWTDYKARQGRSKHGLHLDMLVRCRRCVTCKRARKNHWALRGLAEVQLSSRTWFGTLTIAPHVRFRIDCEAARRIAENKLGTWSYWPSRWGEFARLNARAKFMARHEVAGEMLTKWVKRVRKNSGAKLRVLAVAERHKDGYPHYHVLMHERCGVVTERELRTQWRRHGGITEFTLVDKDDPKEVWYVCKYLAKEADARVRASGSYGVLTKRNTVKKKPIVSMVPQRTDAKEPAGHVPPLGGT